MLRWMREGAKAGFLKFILLGFMAMAVGGLVLMDVGGFFRGGISSTVVAKGSGISISTVQFDKAVRRVLAQQGMSPSEAFRLGLIQMVLNNEIQTRIFNREAQRLGLRAGDKIVMEQVSSIAEPLATDGTSKKEALQRVLRSQGISEGEFIAAIRQEMVNTLFRNALTSGSGLISDSELEEYYQMENESRDIEAFLITSEAAKEITEPTEENLLKYYEANKMEFLIPETRSVTIATLKKEMLKSNVLVTDKELRHMYDEDIDLYQKPEQRKVVQAVLQSQEDAESVTAKLKDGANLSSAVESVTGSADGYLGEEVFERGGLLEEIGGPVFNAQEQEIIGPVQTALGWHVLVVKEIIQPHATPFEDVKADMKDELMQTRLLDELLATANLIDDSLAAGEKLEDVVKELGLTTETFKDFRQTGMNESGKDVLESYGSDKNMVLDEAFAYMDGETTPVLELADGRFIVLRIDAATERSYKPFEEVKADLEKRWIKEQKDLIAHTYALDAHAAIEEGTDLKEAAKETGGSVKTYKNLKKSDDPKAPLNKAAINQIFATSENGAFLAKVSNGYLVGKVTAIIFPDPSKVSDEDMAELKERLARTRPQEMLQQYTDSLTQEYNVKVNQRILMQMYGQPVN